MNEDEFLRITNVEVFFPKHCLRTDVNFTGEACYLFWLLHSSPANKDRHLIHFLLESQL